jgi:O-antigen chain-terminating methyltransferase
LTELLNSVSPDYAVIAQKESSEEIEALHDEVFNKEYGLSLDELSDRFDSRLNITEAKASEAIQQLNLILGSRSWKITEPLRRLTRFLKNIKSRVIS